jgi:uncharacterized protein (TIGR00730 family)
MPARRRYALHDPDLDNAIESLVATATTQFGTLQDDGDSELLRQMVVTILGLAREEATTGDLKLLNSAMKEMRHALRVFEPYRERRKISTFGSARTPKDAPAWKQAHDFSARMTEAGWMTITGGGGGIMEAAQTGAGREESFGVNIRLPFEQQPNPVIADDPKLINFRYFFARKVTFVKESHAIALFPGGFGTLDEGFETLTLIQTGKSELLPVVCIDTPGGSYWRELEAYVASELGASRMISQADHALFHVTDDVDDAVEHVLRFYRNYHSSRYVGERLVIRLCEAPSEAELALLNDEFADLLTKGAISVTEPLPQEDREAAELPRIALHFDRRSTGRLRELVDRLNGFVEAPEAREAQPAATPHQIVEQPLSPEAERRRDEL